MKMHRYSLYLNGKEEGEPLHVEALGALAIGDPHEQSVIAVDGGLHRVPPECLLDRGFRYIGDADSIDPSVGLGHVPQNHLILPQDKDLSDLGAALDEMAQEDSGQEVFFLEIFFGLGGRRDHEWINLAEVARWVNARPGRCLAVFHPGVVIASCAFDWLTPSNTVFSVVDPLSQSPAGDWVEIAGARWSGRLAGGRPSKGLSNETLGGRVRVRTAPGRTVMLMTGGAV